MTPASPAPAPLATWPAITVGGGLFHTSTILFGAGLTSPGAWLATCVVEAAGIAAAHWHGRRDAQKQILVDHIETNPLEPQPDLAALFRASPADGRTGWLAAATIVAPLQGATYLTSWWATRRGVDVAGAARNLLPAAATMPASPSPTAHDPAAAGRNMKLLSLEDNAVGVYEYDPSNPTPLPRGKVGAPIGWNRAGTLVRATARYATLIIGPPGRGKTSCLIEPTVATAPGPCVSTSIKPDVMVHTIDARRAKGRVWLFDPSGTTPAPEGVDEVHWSPLDAVYNWDAAGAVAMAMAKAVGAGGDEGKEAHFVDNAASLLQVLLYAASFEGVETLVRWLRRPSAPQVVAEISTALRNSGEDVIARQSAELAEDTIAALLEDTGANERGSILTTLRRMTKLYQSIGGLRVAHGGNFQPREFVESPADTLYVVVPQDRVELYRHIVVALMTEIYNARGRLFNENEAAGAPQPVPLTLVLDEVANTAPVPLPQWSSQAGGQDIYLVAALQDMSQARTMYGSDSADGMLTIFGDKLLLPGIVDERTTNVFASAAGSFDQRKVSQSFSEQGVSHSYSDQKTERLHADRIAQMPEGQVLHISGARPDFLHAIRWYRQEDRDRLARAIAEGQ